MCWCSILVSKVRGSGAICSVSILIHSIYMFEISRCFYQAIFSTFHTLTILSAQNMQPDAYGYTIFTCRSVQILQALQKASASPSFLVLSQSFSIPSKNFLPFSIVYVATHLCAQSPGSLSDAPTTAARGRCELARAGAGAVAQGSAQSCRGTRAIFQPAFISAANSQELQEKRC